MEEEGGEGWPYVTSEGNHSYWEKFHAKSDKKQKIFFYTPVSQFQKISTLNYLTETKRDTLRISLAVVQKYTIKKVPLKISPPVNLHIIKLDIK